MRKKKPANRYRYCPRCKRRVKKVSFGEAEQPFVCQKCGIFFIIRRLTYVSN